MPACRKGASRASVRALERVGLGDRVDFKPNQAFRRPVPARCDRPRNRQLNRRSCLPTNQPARWTPSSQQIMALFKRSTTRRVTVVMITQTATSQTTQSAFCTSVTAALPSRPQPGNGGDGMVQNPRKADRGHLGIVRRRCGACRHRYCGLYEQQKGQHHRRRAAGFQRIHLILGRPVKHLRHRDERLRAGALPDTTKSDFRDLCEGGQSVKIGDTLLQYDTTKLELTVEGQGARA